MKATERPGYFSEFAWAVPDAFADPLGSCRFERGDILYDTIGAYEGTLAAALPGIRYGLQVEEPLRGAPSAKSEDSAFSDNWNSGVTFNLTDYGAHTTTKHATTQGRLYSLLWKGDLRILDDSTPNPPLPTQTMGCLRFLPEVFGLMRTIVPQKTNVTLFLMPYDATHPLLRRKFSKIMQKALELKGSHWFRSPGDVGLPESFVPTARIACFRFDGVVDTEVERAIKDAVYVPSPNRISEEDKFRLSAHGYLGSF